MSGKISLNKAHKGEFTAWCKANGFSGVTAEAIAAGKKAPSAHVREMANFADNARKWEKK